jgi:class 3 adenylate cyclase
VLRFIGDAALAIFPVGEDPRPAGANALAAARDTLGRMDKFE